MPPTNPAPNAVPAPKPAPKKFTVTPRPVYHQTTAIPRKRKPIVKKKPGTSLADELSAYLPTGGINSAPEKNAIINLPITFWSGTSQTFQSLVQILGVGVNLSLKASYQWDFGDGITQTTSDPGSTYPNGNITHLYKAPGNYQIKLRVTWSGTWLYAGALTPIPAGALWSDYSRDLIVYRAPSSFVE